MVVAVEVMSWTRLCSVLVFVINCLVTSSICCLIRSVILFAVVELLVFLFLFLIKSAEAQILSLMFVGVLLVVLSCNRN